MIRTEIKILKDMMVQQDKIIENLIILGGRNVELNELRSENMINLVDYETRKTLLKEEAQRLNEEFDRLKKIIEDIRDNYLTEEA